MLRDFIWSEGMGIGQPWVSVVNTSPNSMAVEFKIQLDKGGPVVTWNQTVAPWKRYSQHLKPIVGESHFWLRVRINQPGAATLTSWTDAYTLPPYTPPPSVYDISLEASRLEIDPGTPEPK